MTSDITLLISDIADQLEKAGNTLSEGERNISPLRNIQGFLLQIRTRISEEQNTDIQFLSLFFEMFIDKVCFNLTGDIPDVENLTGKVQIDFNKNIGNALQKLSSNLRKQEYSKFYECYVQMGMTYINAVNTLNRGFEQECQRLS
jgi:hypothetical protein